MMVVKASLAHGLQTSVGKLLQGDDDFSDCTIVVENTSFKCHRLILIACSGVFQSLFRSGMKESLEGIVLLPAISKITFDTILNSIYKGIDGLTIDNILDVWSATEYLQIDYLIEECKNFVSHNISSHNVCKLLNHAMLYSAKNLVDDCLEFIVKNFEEVNKLEHFFQLTFHSFHKVITSDILAAVSEDSVLDTILKWVNYKPSLEHCPVLFYETLDKKAAKETQSPANISPHSLSVYDIQDDNDGQKNTTDCPEKGSKNLERGNESQEKENSEQTDAGNDEDRNLSELSETMVKEKFRTKSMSVDSKTICNKNDNSQAVYREEVRKEYFSQLLSACRYFLVKPSYLENLLYNHTQLLVETGTHKLVVNALMYTMRVDRRHNCWPVSAIHRTSSPNKHVMVFLSQDKFMAYSLDSGTIHEFSRVQVTYSTHFIATVFDNVLYYQHGNEDIYGERNQTFLTLTEQKQWVSINTLTSYPWDVLLAHGSYIYGLYNMAGSLFRSACMPSLKISLDENWSHVCTQLTASCLVRFHQYIVIFGTQHPTATVYFYNTEMPQFPLPTATLDGTCKDMASFTHGEDVYILQINGTLWKLFSSDKISVDFELVSKLWDCDCSLKGCILYKNKLFIFCDESKMIPNLLVTSLTGLCENIEIIKLTNTKTRCLPMVLHESWFMP